MFEFITGGKNKFIGIDFGTSSIKVVALAYKNERVYLENYGIVDLNLEAQSAQKSMVKNQSFEEKLNVALKNVLKKMKIGSGLAYVSIPSFSGLITLIDLPEMNEDELGRAIQFEAHKYIPSSLDEVAMSWEIVNHKDIANKLIPVPVEDPKKKKTIKVLLVAAPKREIEKYDRLIHGTDLNVSAIELETFPIARALIGEENAPCLIIDIGARSTNMILIDDGTVCVNRTIEAGGSDITSAVSDSVSISRTRAESFKKGEKDILNSSDTPIMMPILELITSESQRIMSAYIEKNGGRPIAKVILSGGTSKMRGIREYFNKNLKIPAELGDPWKNIIIDQRLAPAITEIGTSFSVAVGLALRGVDDYKRK